MRTRSGKSTVSHPRICLIEYLNWHGKLTRQRPTGVFKLLYNAAGTHLCACVPDTSRVKEKNIWRLPVRGFVADSKTFWFETADADEAHYLCAILNAPMVDASIEPFQTKGAFGSYRGKGERDICRRPFEVLPITAFDRKSAQHQRLAELSKDGHARVRGLIQNMEEKTRKKSIGILRQVVRRELESQLQEIDPLVRELLGEVSPAPGAEKSNGVRKMGGPSY